MRDPGARPVGRGVVVGIGIIGWRQLDGLPDGDGASGGVNGRVEDVDQDQPIIAQILGFDNR